jgi:hypothetical protein
MACGSESEVFMMAIQSISKRIADEQLKQPRVGGDQRNEKRILSHAPLVFAPFSSRFHREYASMTLNHSKDGMCLESGEPFRPGAVLYIRLGNAPEDQLYRGNWNHLRTSTLAEVKWCREYRDEFSAYYRIGVKYY